jgi:hypothetical protein
MYAKRVKTKAKSVQEVNISSISECEGGPRGFFTSKTTEEKIIYEDTLTAIRKFS